MYMDYSMKSWCCIHAPGAISSYTIFPSPPTCRQTHTRHTTHDFRRHWSIELAHGRSINQIGVSAFACGKHIMYYINTLASDTQFPSTKYYHYFVCLASWPCGTITYWLTNKYTVCTLVIFTCYEFVVFFITRTSFPRVFQLDSCVVRILCVCVCECLRSSWIYCYSNGTDGDGAVWLNCIGFLQLGCRYSICICANRSTWSIVCIMCVCVCVDGVCLWLWFWSSSWPDTLKTNRRANALHRIALTSTNTPAPHEYAYHCLRSAFLRRLVAASCLHCTGHNRKVYAQQQSWRKNAPEGTPRVEWCSNRQTRKCHSNALQSLSHTQLWSQLLGNKSRTCGSLHTYAMEHNVQNCIDNWPISCRDPDFVRFRELIVLWPYQ